MAADLDDTVIGPSRPVVGPGAASPLGSTEDTVITVGRSIPAPLPPVEPAPVVMGTVSAVRVGLQSDPIPLSVPVLVGRNPTAPRVVSGGIPRLVRVSSPGKEVSATHLEVRQLGSSVVVTDLRSTNGSIVMVPGRAPRTLRQGESMVVSPGTLVDIGDDTILQILTLHENTHDPGSGRSGRQS